MSNEKVEPGTGSTSAITEDSAPSVADSAEKVMPKEWRKASKDFPPNIKFVGKSRVLDKETGKYKEEPVPAERVPTLRINGREVFNLPPGDIQKAGFWHSNAKFLLKAYRDDFKQPTGRSQVTNNPQGE